jgi:hypothetical protein
MPFSYSLTQAYSLTETDGSGYSSSVRTTALAPTVLLHSGTNVVYSKAHTFAAADPVGTNVTLDLRSLTDDERGTVQYSVAMGLIIAIDGPEGVKVKVTSDGLADPWTACPVAEVQGKSTVQALGLYGTVNSVNRRLKVEITATDNSADTVVSVIVAGAGAVV